MYNRKTDLCLERCLSFRDAYRQWKEFYIYFLTKYWKSDLHYPAHSISRNLCIAKEHLRRPCVQLNVISWQTFILTSAVEEVRFTIWGTLQLPSPLKERCDSNAMHNSMLVGSCLIITKCVLTRVCIPSVRKWGLLTEEKRSPEIALVGSTS